MNRDRVKGNWKQVTGEAVAWKSKSPDSWFTQR